MPGKRAIDQSEVSLVQIFFIKQGERIFVIEIKDDDEIKEPSPENIKKHEYALEHFDKLNDWLKNQKLATRYQFNMVTPKDFGKYFTKLRETAARRVSVGIGRKGRADDEGRIAPASITTLVISTKCLIFPVQSEPLASLRYPNSSSDAY
jgi:hypothetical protein